MEFLDNLYQLAKKNKKRIVLPEGRDKRVLKAVEILLRRDICKPVLIGDPEDILKISKKEGIDLKDTKIIDDKEYEALDKYVEFYCELRKHKNVKPDEARRIIRENPVFYAALMVRSGDADGFVAGSSTTTRDVAKAAIYCIGPSEDTATVSSSSIIILPDKSLGAKGVFVYADCGIVPDPTAQQLRDIAISSSKIAKMVLDDEVRVAMLSYSTKGSGGSEKSIMKVREATKLVQERMPDLLVDGEIQVDAAVVPEVAERKDPDGKIKGRANVFIFPNLDAGNIAYKLTHRLAKARSIGPLLQGLRKPASDLSRGCDTQDIVDAVAITVVRVNESIK